MHITKNPYSLATNSVGTSDKKSSIPHEQLKILKAENKDLSKDLLNAKNQISVNCAASNTGEAAPVEQVVATADSAKLNQRLKEMFKERITSFREAVYLLTGYKVADTSVLLLFYIFIIDVSIILD